MRVLNPTEFAYVSGSTQPAGGSSAAMAAASAINALNEVAEAVDTLLDDISDFGRGLADGIWDAL